MTTSPFYNQWLLVLLFLLGIHTPGFCEQDPFKLGQVTLDDLKMTSYAPDTSAAAVVLSDVGESSFTFTNGTQLLFKRVIRIKILKKAGLGEADFVIPFYKKDANNKEVVFNLKGVTYTLENGSMVKTKLDDKSVFEEKRDANWFLKKLTMPGVKVGSVVELSYSIKSDFLHLLREWEFQHHIPVKWSEYRVGMVPFFEYTHALYGNQPYHLKDTKIITKSTSITWKKDIGMMKVDETGTIVLKIVQYQWAMKDVPAFTAEPYLANAKDYLAKLEFVLSKVQYPNEEPKYVAGDWESFTKELLKEEDFGGQLLNTTYLRTTAIGLVAGKTDTLEKVKAITAYVKSQMNWNGKHRIYTENLKKAYDARTGSSAEVNLLLTALLREAGVAAHPMLVSTRDNGQPLTASPMISKFDYVIAQVTAGGKNYLLDATEKNLPFGMLPFRCLNGQGWVAQQPAGKWLPLNGTERNGHLVSGTLVIKPTGEITGAMQESYLGMPAIDARSSIRDKGQDAYVKEFANAGSDWMRQKITIQNLENVQEPLTKNYQLARTGDDQPASLLYLSPMLTHAQDNNPFKLATRQYPINFASLVDKKYVVKFQLPAGYKVEELPEPSVITLPQNAAKFSYIAQVINGELQVTSQLNINKTTFSPQEYGNLREFYSRMVAKHAEKVVLKKM